MNPLVDELLGLLDLERIEENLFRGTNRDIGSKNVFGGQVLAQALIAAGRTVDPARKAHSVHGYFLRPGDMAVPIVYEVDRIRDGGSFTTRRVVAIQHGKAIFNMAASFQITEEGLEHQDEMPQVQQPEELVSELEMRRMIAHNLPEKLRERFTAERPIELRPIDPLNPFQPEKKGPQQYIWFRAPQGLPDDPLLHRSVLAYASDFGLLATGMRVHGLSFLQRNVQVASLDHAIWFHREARADQWLLYAMDSPSAGNARDFNRGRIYTQDGVLVASTAQEGLMRIRLDIDSA